MLTHLQRLEAESIHIIREAVAESERPVMLYSIGKDSSVLLHLAMKAFYPARPPFPLLHVDTTWKFRAMYEMRDTVAQRYGIDLLVYQNPECVERGINPFTHGSALHTGRHKAVITAETIASTFVTPAPHGRKYGAHVGDEPGAVISPAFAHYQWDGETGYGGLERSAPRTAITIPGAGHQEDERKS